MRPLPLLMATGFLLALAPLAAAGTQESPEIKDGTDDADASGVLDIAAVWIDGADPLNLTFHILVPKLPGLAAKTGGCSDPGCAALTLSFKLEFEVVAPDGKPAPTLEGYNRTYAVYRHGAPASLQSAVGAFDDDGNLAFTGSANATVAAGGEVVLRIPRNSTAVNLPTGATPGAYRIHDTLAYSSPQLCSPPPAVEPPVVGYPVATPCTSPPKPTQTGGTPPAGTTSQWDTAPDAGFGSDYVFAAPPIEAADPAPSATPSASASTSPTAAPEPVPATQPSGTAAPAASTTASADTAKPQPSSTSSKATPAFGLAFLLAGLAAAVAVRRRL